MTGAPTDTRGLDPEVYAHAVALGRRLAAQVSDDTRQRVAALMSRSTHSPAVALQAAA
jgi:hypothetical protein